MPLKREGWASLFGSLEKQKVMRNSHEKARDENTTLGHTEMGQRQRVSTREYFWEAVADDELKIMVPVMPLKIFVIMIRNQMTTDGATNTLVSSNVKQGSANTLFVTKRKVSC